MIRVVLADDQPLVRAALEMVITETADVEVVGEAGDGLVDAGVGEVAVPEHEGRGPVGGADLVAAQVDDGDLAPRCLAHDVRGVGRGVVG